MAPHEAHEALVRGVAEIGTLTAELQDVVAKTKLLGFNAAIVAAQAGEQGRSFGVVAEQMKALNQRALRAVRQLLLEQRALASACAAAEPAPATPLPALSAGQGPRP